MWSNTDPVNTTHGTRIAALPSHFHLKIGIELDLEKTENLEITTHETKNTIRYVFGKNKFVMRNEKTFRVEGGYGLQRAPLPLRRERADNFKTGRKSVERRRVDLKRWFHQLLSLLLIIDDNSRYCTKFRDPLGPFAFSGACAAQRSRSRAVQLGCDASVATPKYVIVEESRRLAAAAAQVGRVAQAPAERQMARPSSLYGRQLDKDNCF
ncbi:unnamed protein product [Euphydryas editha]|uniref:Uncharacterized protein n=1 Tax=Euphydryas editha TaxID=104508 RepID=A0AAU9UMP5_EUPED|nr:unnamed protein product [Euphydryas editha]